MSTECSIFMGVDLSVPFAKRKRPCIRAHYRNTLALIKVAILSKEVTMAVSGKYGKIDIPKVGVDEPVFILRAQDKLAEMAIEMYRLLAASHGCQLANTLEKEIESFRIWPGTKKMPD